MTGEPVPCVMNGTATINLVSKPEIRASETLAHTARPRATRRRRLSPLRPSETPLHPPTRGPCVVGVRVVAEPVVELSHYLDGLIIWLRALEPKPGREGDRHSSPARSRDAFAVHKSCRLGMAHSTPKCQFILKACPQAHVSRAESWLLARNLVDVPGLLYALAVPELPTPKRMPTT